MTRRAGALVICAALLAAPLSAQGEDFDPITVDVVDAINCKIDAPTYTGFALTLDGDDGGAKQRKWRKIKSKNAFLAEWVLPEPILVEAGHTTSRIAFSSSGIMAILDLADPATLAKAEGIKNDADPAALIAALGLTAEQIAQMPVSTKFLGERVIVDETRRDEELKMTLHTQIKRTISNVTSHPGKTLYGCSYRIEIKDIED